jgi:phosphoribosylformimino-5-aminoimidazole carboxamide ribotide isomerase
MIAVPALDLRDGACVQLVGGAYAEECVRLADPLAVARRWRAAGFARLHVVDLDAATGRGSNRPVIEALLAQGGAALQVGGGVRDQAAADALLAAGAARVVVGTRAVEDPGWLAALAARHPGRVVLAADARGREVTTRGWTAGSGRAAAAVAAAADGLPLAGVLVTAVEHEGRLAGPDLALVRAVAGATRAPVIASGGIGSLEDLRRLAAAGAAEAVVGMALYTGALEGGAVAKEFGS